MDIVIRLSDFMMQTHPRAAAQSLADAPISEVAKLLEEIPATTASALLEHILQHRALDCLSQLDAQTAGSIMNAMSPEVASRILLVADRTTEDALLKNVRPAHARSIRVRTRLREDTVGALLETTPPLTTTSTVSDGRDYVTRYGYPYVYIADDNGRLMGVVHAPRLWQEEPTRKLSSLMTPNVECLNDQTPVASVQDHPIWSHFDMVPVVDAHNTYVGALRHKTVRRQTATESAKTGIDAAIATLLDLSEMYWSAGTHMMLGPGAAGPATTRRES